MLKWHRETCEPRLKTCHPDLQRVVRAAFARYDFVVLEGHRDKAGQEKAFAEKTTTLHWPHGKHNATPSNAVDLAPFPVDFKDRKRFYRLQEIMFEEAKKLKIKLRWGGDWDRDGKAEEPKETDLPHYELAP